MTTLAPHQQRVVDEKTELSDRLSKLLNFLQTPIFAGLDAAEKARLRSQARFMDGYCAVLEERIAAFTEAKPERAYLSEEWLLRYAQEAAYSLNAPSYCPKTVPEAKRFLPHRWVMEAIQSAWLDGQAGKPKARLNPLMGLAPDERPGA